jgi:hypothetical protein
VVAAVDNTVSGRAGIAFRHCPSRLIYSSSFEIQVDVDLLIHAEPEAVERECSLHEGNQVTTP